MEIDEVEKKIDTVFHTLLNDPHNDKDINLTLESINLCYAKFARVLKAELRRN